MGQSPTLDAEASRTSGLWWKSLLLAWLLTRPVGPVTLVIDAEPPVAVGIGVLGLAWGLTWVAWRTQDHRVRRWPFIAGGSPLAALQRLVAAFIVAVLLLGNAVLALDADGGLGRRTVPPPRVAVVVTAVALASLLGTFRWVPALDPASRERLAASYRARLFGRLAWSELPALVAFGGFLAVGGEAWLYGIGLAAALAGLVRAFPTRAALGREQSRPNNGGRAVDLLDALGASEPSP